MNFFLNTSLPNQDPSSIRHYKPLENLTAYLLKSQPTAIRPLLTSTFLSPTHLIWPTNEKKKKKNIAKNGFLKIGSYNMPIKENNNN